MCAHAIVIVVAVEVFVINIFTNAFVGDFAIMNMDLAVAHVGEVLVVGYDDESDAFALILSYRGKLHQSLQRDPLLPLGKTELGFYSQYMLLSGQKNVVYVSKPKYFI